MQNKQVHHGGIGGFSNADGDGGDDDLKKKIKYLNTLFLNVATL